MHLYSICTVFQKSQMMLNGILNNVTSYKLFLLTVVGCQPCLSALNLVQDLCFSAQECIIDVSDHSWQKRCEYLKPPKGLPLSAVLGLSTGCAIGSSGWYRTWLACSPRKNEDCVNCRNPVPAIWSQEPERASKTRCSLCLCTPLGHKGGSFECSVQCTLDWNSRSCP